MIGNSSSGIIEAASFGCYVVNVGNRQKGRLTSANVFHCAFKKSAIVHTVEKIKGLESYNRENIYFKPNSIDLIFKALQIKE